MTTPTTELPASFPPEREVLDWEEFGRASRELAVKVVESAFRPDIVVAVARGGLLLAGSVAYALGTRNCGSINVEFYTGIDEQLPEPVLHPPLLDAPALSGKNVLLVDDVSDSGRTLAMVLELLQAHGATVKTLTLYSKSRTVLAPDYVWRDTERWITFPWSALAPLTAP
ncbi:phosphoribosyltransferase [Mycetocola sp.]|jgi:hypoxanthine phosphoribosyltransferase|uniref:phosphoribosyltransferase n=1 Tax=Mycetocola sp. TaxID=1871042 RepID=UPI00262A0C36|nr:phosphoribosyltransferase [Mycetocola sp.]MCU1559638.1 phosphoribosyltransferase [Mycetocola sp.]